MSRLSPGPRHAEWAPSSPRYVALDVDGTLVGPDGAVADAVVAACREAQDAGLHVGLATGRMALGVSDVLDRTGLRGPHLLHNGAEVRVEGEVVASTPIAPAAARALVDEAIASSRYLEVYVDDGYLVTSDDERAADHWAILGREPLARIADGRELDGRTTRVPKVTAIAFEPDEVDGIVELLARHGLTAGPAGSPATPHLTYVNGTDPAADKGTALRAAADHLGVDVAAAVALGDAGNDLPLLRTAGTAIAMGQADEEVRAIAHLLAPPVTEDGAAAVLRTVVGGFDGLRPGPDRRVAT